MPTPNCVTPYLPTSAHATIKGWMAGGKPVFVKAPARSESDPDACPNCAGLGNIFVVFVEGPFPSPALGATVSTWFDGDGRFRQGWYNIVRRDSYPCPECEKHPRISKPYVLPHQQMVASLAKKLGRKEQLDD